MTDTTDGNERTWGMLAHLAAFAGLIPLPVLGTVLGPLLVWLAQRERSEFVAANAKEALNFNISVLIAGAVCTLLAYVYIGILLNVALFFYWVTMTILAGIRAGEGLRYHYPFSLRLIK